MHTYSISSHERKTVPFYLAGLSILVIFLLKHWTTMPSWLPIPSVVALYGIFYGLFNNYIWRWGFLRTIGVIKTPNLNGVWDAISKSSFNNFSKEYYGKLEIQQTWTEISLFLDGEKATSSSIMAAVIFVNHTRFSLEWEYLSKKKPQFTETDYMHYGLTRLQLELGSTSEMLLKGDYFTDIHRHYYGEMSIKKRKA
jgi:hypothetical protein